MDNSHVLNVACFIRSLQGRLNALLVAVAGLEPARAKPKGLLYVLDSNQGPISLPTELTSRYVQNALYDSNSRSNCQAAAGLRGISGRNGRQSARFAVQWARSDGRNPPFPAGPRIAK